MLEFTFVLQNLKGKTCGNPFAVGDNLCQSNPCWSGGTCIIIASDWSCTCPPGYTGNSIINRIWECSK